MNQKEWKKRYINRLKQYGLSNKMAIEIYNGCTDFDDDPEDVADDEMYYWAADSICKRIR